MLDTRRPATYTQPLPVESDSFIRWMWFFIHPHRTRFFLAVANRIAMTTLWSLSGLWIALITTSLYAGTHATAAWLLAGMTGSWVCASSLGLLRTYIEGPVRDLMKRELSIFSLQRIMRHQLSWHEQKATGNKMQRILTGREGFSGIFRILMESVIPLAGHIIGIAVVCIALGQPLFVVWYLIAFIVCIGISTRLIAPIIRLTYQADEYFEQIIGKVYEYTSATHTVKTLNLMPHVLRQAWQAERTQWHTVRQLFVAIYRKWFITDAYIPIVFFGIIPGYALYLLTQSQVEPAFVIAVLAASGTAWDALATFIAIQDDFVQSRTGFMRLVSMLRAEPIELDVKPAKKLPTGWQELQIQNVDYNYDDTHALRDLDITIPRGQTVALVGKSGAGKSTFVKLILKQAVPTSGSISFDSVDMRYIPQSQVANHIAVVLQDTELFDISVRDNVLLRAKHPKRLKKYLQMAHAYDFVQQLPQQEDTLIGERGVRLSGGQKQRIGIARALAQEAKVIVFDEATSALDTESERAIQAAMGEMFQSKTAIIIAHRLSTIQHADRILVFDQGRIIEDGSFNQLVKKRNGIFAKLWKMQKLD